MTTYKEIRGTHIKTVTTDPPAPVNGQMWYNSTTQTIKGFTSNPVGSWATGGTLNSARGVPGGLGATQNAALYIGGSQTVASVEQYDGTSFSEVNDLNTGRKGSTGTGTTTAGLASGGDTGPSGSAGNGVTNVESWNGSSWTETTDINTQRQGAAGSGTSTSTLVFGGYGSPGTQKADVEYCLGS